MFYQFINPKLILYQGVIYPPVTLTCCSHQPTIATITPLNLQLSNIPSTVQIQRISSSRRRGYFSNQCLTTATVEIYSRDLWVNPNVISYQRPLSYLHPSLPREITLVHYIRFSHQYYSSENCTQFFIYNYSVIVFHIRVKIF